MTVSKNPETWISDVNIRGQGLTRGHTGHLVELGVVDEVGPVPVDEGAERQAVLPASPRPLKGQKVKHVTKRHFWSFLVNLSRSTNLYPFRVRLKSQKVK